MISSTVCSPELARHKGRPILFSWQTDSFWSQNPPNCEMTHLWLGYSSLKYLDRITGETLWSSDLGCFPSCNSLNKISVLTCLSFVFDSLVLWLDGAGSPSGPRLLRPEAEAPQACHVPFSPGIPGIPREPSFRHLSVVAWQGLKFDSWFECSFGFVLFLASV